MANRPRGDTAYLIAYQKEGLLGMGIFGSFGCGLKGTAIQQDGPAQPEAILPVLSVLYRGAY
jgi:hypothetical protein